MLGVLQLAAVKPNADVTVRVKLHARPSLSLALRSEDMTFMVVSFINTFENASEGGQSQNARALLLSAVVLTTLQMGKALKTVAFPCLISQLA